MVWQSYVQIMPRSFVYTSVPTLRRSGNVASSAPSGILPYRISNEVPGPPPVWWRRIQQTEISFQSISIAPETRSQSAPPAKTASRDPSTPETSSGNPSTPETSSRNTYSDYGGSEGASQTKSYILSLQINFKASLIRSSIFCCCALGTRMDPKWTITIPRRL